MHATTKVRFLEDDEFGQKETNRETEQERNDVSGDITRHFYAKYLYYLAMQPIVIADEVNEQAQHRYPAAASDVSECLYGDPFSERRIEPIDDGQDGILYKIDLSALFIAFHQTANVMKIINFVRAGNGIVVNCPHPKMRRALQWICYSSAFASLCALALCMATEKLAMGGLLWAFWPMHLWAFSGTLCLYNLHYLVKHHRSRIVKGDRAVWSAERPSLHLWALGFGAAALIFASAFMPLRVLGAAMPLGLLAIGYSFPIVRTSIGGRRRKLREWGMGKPFLLAFVWTGVTLGLPLVYIGKAFEGLVYEGLSRFLFIAALCLAFDIRDQEADHAQGLRTWPNKIGRRGTWAMAYACLALVAMGAFLAHGAYPGPRDIGLWSVCAFAAFLMYKAQRNRSDLFYLFYVDGLMLAYAIVILWA